jgi:signal transduction histidine kinase
MAGVLQMLTPAAIPLVLRAGARLPWSVVAPLTCSIAAGYGFLTRRGQLRATAEAERLRIYRDLHDTVGTTLSLVALYGSILESRASDSVETQRLAVVIREAANQGLQELRAVLRALPQSATTLRQLADELSLAGARSTTTTGSSLAVSVREGSDVQVSGLIRTTLLRVFQESLHNALRHGRARFIEACLAADADSLEVLIADDGVGFDPAIPTPGTGLRGMQARVSEIGGNLLVRSAPGAGSQIQLQLPLAPAPS